MVGKVLGGRYEILEQIGGGGMALVYKARCKLLDRLVAIKILKDEFANDDEFVRKFKRESQAAASLSHPNIVNIYDVGVENHGDKDIHYIVMEYIKGGTLKDLIVEKGRLSIDETVDYSNQIASALQDAHRNNIVHRDIKPQNIMITDDNRVKVTDFGIARAATSSTVTAKSDVLGSVHYFSPEQARGGYTDEKSDIYSLGIVMYEMITGKLPYEAESPITVALKHIQEEIIPPREIYADIPESLENIILKAVQKRQVDRYANISEIIRDLRKIKINVEEKIFDNSSDTESHTRIIPAVNIEDDNSMKKKKKKRQTKKDGGMKIIFLGIFLAFLLTTGVFLMSFKFKDLFSNSEDIIMIDIVGEDEEKARQAILDLNLEFEVKDRVKNSEFEAGKIIWQSVEEGTPLKKNYPVQVTVSEGSDLVQVPDLINRDILEAERILSDYDLKISIDDYKYSETIDADLIMEQEPRKLEEVKAGTRIRVVVSQGKEEKNISMPKLIGWDIEKARKEIERLGLIVGDVKSQPDEDEAKNIITWQSYNPGTELEPKTVVDFYISDGPGDVDIENNNNDKDKDKDKNDKPEDKPVSKEGPFTFTVTPLQEKEETVIKVIRIQDGVSEVVHNETYSVNEREITITVTGKLGTKFEIFYDGEFQKTLIKNE